MATLLKQWGTYWLRSNQSTSPYGYDSHGRIRVYLDNQSISGNYSDISIKHYGIARATDKPYYGGVTNVSSSYRANNGSFGGTYYTKTKSYYEVSSQSDEEFYIGTTTHRIYHNVDGTAQLYVNGSYTATTYEGYDLNVFTGTRTSSFYMALPSIPRATTINSFTWVKASGAAGLSRLTCNWATAHSIDRIQYSLNGGAYTTVTGNGTSGSFNISGLTPNTQYSLKIKVRRADSQVETESSVKSATTYDIAKITVAPNNNIDMDSTSAITYTNPSGASLQISLYKTDGATAIASYRACSGTGYTFTYSAGEKTAFYNQIPSTKTLPLRFYLRTSDGLGNTYLNYVERTFEVFNANPTFTTWTYADTNAATLALTGNSQKIIKGYSNVKATITSANKMVAIKGATAIRYQLTIGAKNATVNYSPSSTVEMTINAVDNNVFNCYAIDSRGESTNVIKTLATDYINYTPISITKATATRTDDIGTETTLAYNGTFFGGSFGSVTNTIKSATYKFKKTTDANYTDGTSVITPTTNGNTFSFSGTIKGDAGDDGVNGFDATYSYNIQVTVTDELSTRTFNFILGSGKPNIAIHKEGVAINQAYDETLGGALQVNGITTQINNGIKKISSTNYSSVGATTSWMKIFQVRRIDSTAVGSCFMNIYISPDRWQTATGRTGANLIFGSRDSETLGSLLVVGQLGGTLPTLYTMVQETISGVDYWVFYMNANANTAYYIDVSVYSTNDMLIGWVNSNVASVPAGVRQYIGTPSITVEDVLTSTSTINPLSANMGKTLKTAVDTKLTGAGTVVDSLADDTAMSVTPPAQYGIVIDYGRHPKSRYIGGMFVYRCASTNALCEGMSIMSSSERALGALAGTTGTDGKFTVSANTDGKVYFENRMGASVTFGYIFIGS